MDTQIFNQLAMAGGQSKSIFELAKPSGADPLLLSQYCQLSSMIFVDTKPR